MYKRLNNTVFTVKNSEEKKFIIDTINSNKQISKFFKCVGLDVEQFTGKINAVLMKMDGQLCRFRVTGSYPVMKLDQVNSNNIYTVEFPSSTQVNTVVEKSNEILPEAVERRVIEKKEKEDDVAVELCAGSISVENGTIILNPIKPEEPKVIEVKKEEDTPEEVIEQPKPQEAVKSPAVSKKEGKRGRKKKQISV